MESIKIGRKVVEIKEGDYILYNGACYQFFAGDGRTLKSGRFNTWSNLLMSNAVVKQISFNSMRSEVIKRSGMELILWYF